MITFKVDNLKSMSAQLSAFAELLKTAAVCEDDIFLSRLVSSELISNAIRHGGEEAEFRCEICVDRINITVRASSFEGVELNPPPPSALAESGRGFYIINSVSLNGIECGEGGTLTVAIKRTDKN